MRLGQHPVYIRILARCGMVPLTEFPLRSYRVLKSWCRLSILTTAMRVILDQCPSLQMQRSKGVRMAMGIDTSSSSRRAHVNSTNSSMPFHNLMAVGMLRQVQYGIWACMRYVLQPGPPQTRLDYRCFLASFVMKRCKQ